MTDTLDPDFPAKFKLARHQREALTSLAQEALRVKQRLSALRANTAYALGQLASGQLPDAPASQAADRACARVDAFYTAAQSALRQTYSEAEVSAVLKRALQSYGLHGRDWIYKAEAADYAARISTEEAAE